MYESITYETILEEMLKRIPSDFDKSEGSVIYDALAPAAVELKLMYVEFDNVLKESFADTASREYLIRRASERAFEPYYATKAILKGEFKPDNIDVSKERFSIGKMTYEVKDKSEDGSYYEVECETAGTIGNRFLDKLIPINYIKGLESAVLTDVLIPARDDEDTEDFRERYLKSFEGLAFGGNIQDYINKTNAIKGVGGTKVIPVWDGGGTVKLIIIDAEYNAAGEALVKKVQKTIDPPEKVEDDSEKINLLIYDPEDYEPQEGQGHGYGLAPIGHTVTVFSVIERIVSIEPKLSFKDNYDYDNTKEKIKDVINSYFLELRKNWSKEDNLVIRKSHLEARLLNIKGVYDVLDIKIDSKSENLALEYDEIPALEKDEEVEEGKGEDGEEENGEDGEDGKDEEGEDGVDGKDEEGEEDVYLRRR